MQVALTTLLAFACSGRPRPPPPTISHPDTRPVASSAAAKAFDSSAAFATPEKREPLVLLTDLAALGRLERKGLSLASMLGVRGSIPLDNRELSGSARYASVIDVLARDIEAVRAADPQAGVGVHRFSHRLFDVRWLRSEIARFELVAAVHRFDRAPFHASSCGEVRLVYRLAYATSVRGSAVASRLPMTLGIEIPVPREAGGCTKAARRWMVPAGLEGEALAARLTSAEGPLAAARLEAGFASHRLVVNVQELRWPSAVRPDLGGHAEYLLRTFRLAESGSRYEPLALENTPDVPRLKADPKLRRELLAWLASPENLANVDRGTPLVPERFLAKRALSVTPRGLARRANRPFSELFSRDDVAGFDLSKLRHARSPESLLRRLDQLSCQGCHEARSIAGFHLLGEDPAEAPAANALLTGSSPHLGEDLGRRRALAEAAARGDEEPLDFTQPFAERGEYAGYGAHCGLGPDASFAEWRCAEGLVCRAYDAPVGEGVGQCLPPEPGRAGDPCQVGPLDPARDRVARVERAACAPNAVCNTNAVGFPGGMCTETCGELSPGAACGNIAILDPFNACVARGEPFLDCVANNVRPAGFRACDLERPCRDDYVCTRTNDRSGVCIPPYFLFQLRVDGHP